MIRCSILQLNNTKHNTRTNLRGRRPPTNSIISTNTTIKGNKGTIELTRVVRGKKAWNEARKVLRKRKRKINLFLLNISYGTLWVSLETREERSVDSLSFAYFFDWRLKQKILDCDKNIEEQISFFFYIAKCLYHSLIIKTLIQSGAISNVSGLANILKTFKIYYFNSTKKWRLIKY